MASSVPRRPFEFVANHIVLDFVNTVNGRPEFTRDDLAAAEHIFEWVQAAGLAASKEQLTASSADPTQFLSAIELRETLYGVFGPIAGGDRPQSAALTAVTRRAAQALRSAQWINGRAGYQPTWPPDSIELICDRLADEAVLLLRSHAAGRIGSCAGCGWLFLDTSRGHARRWCSMNMCGVRDKMRRYHQRQTSATGAL
jgi:predicted RNA-binding Zn ribbon-like protein